MKKILSVFLITLLALVPLSFTFAVSAAETVIYLKDSGDDTKNGTTPETAVATIAKAYTLLPAGGTLVVCGDATISADFAAPVHTGVITITSKYNGVDYRTTASARLIFNGSLYLNGQTIFKDLNIHVTATNKALACNGHKVILDTGIVCTGTTADVTYILSVVGGAFAPANSLSDLSKSTDLTINSGTWRTVRGGNRASTSDEINGDIKLTINGGEFHSNIAGGTNPKVNGNVYVTITGVTFLGNVSASNNGTEITGTVNGNVSLTITGGTFKRSIDLCTREQNKVTGTGLLTITGGNFDDVTTIKGVNCVGGSTIDYSGYADPASIAAKISGFNQVIDTPSAPPRPAVFKAVQESAVQNNKFDIRLIATVDALDYEAAGFDVVADYSDGAQKEFHVNCTYVYNKLTGKGGDGGIQEYTAADLGGNFLMALTIKGIPADIGLIAFSVTPYVMENGEKISGDTKTVYYLNGEYVESGG